MTILDWKEIAEAAHLIRDGALVGMPTETVYGLAGDATSDQAVARIYAAKGRPHFNPLIAHVSTMEMAQRLAIFQDAAVRLAEEFWPGPLTLVLQRRADCPVSLLACAGLGTIAVRMPRHPIAQALIGAVARPLAAPSANPSGRISPTEARHVVEGLGDKVAMVLDGGPCAVGLESTIIKVTDEDATLLRPGSITIAAIAASLGRPLMSPSPTSLVEAPGGLASHYAPHAPIRLNVRTPQAHEVWLGFGTSDEIHPATLWLSQTGDLIEAAANLFALMHRADALCRSGKHSAIAVAPIPDEGLGIAINDRLSRAAA